ncbi:hypothetical protein LEMLEM_LOCUS2490, partial [Lemmus lemmus]
TGCLLTDSSPPPHGRISLYSTGCSGTHSVDQIDLKLKRSAFSALGLQVLLSK